MQVLSSNDYIIVLNKGKIKYQGSYSDLPDADPDVAHFFKTNRNSTIELNSIKNKEEDETDDSNSQHQASANKNEVRKLY